MLPDILHPDLFIVFCGTAAGTQSAERQCYYAGPGNQFYNILSRTRLTERLLSPEEFRLLPDYGIGLTDLNQCQSGMDHQLTHDAFDVEGFRQKMATHNPRIVAFNGKNAARRYFGVSPNHPITYGEQHQTLEKTRLFVLPSTSGAARGFWDEQVWHKLATEVQMLKELLTPQ